MEIVQINNPVDRELHSRELSELVGVSPESIFQALHSILEKQQRRKKYQKRNQSLKPQTENKKQFLENDLIRLCFSKDVVIRKYLFDNVNQDWLVTAFSKTIFEKVYIHLHSENAPEVGLIMNELNESIYRDELAKLVFDLEKLTPTLKSAQNCVLRLEQSWINVHIQSLREELKNVESASRNPIPIMKKIEVLQYQKKKLSNEQTADE